MTKQNNEILMKNYETHPISSIPCPKLNTTKNKRFKYGGTYNYNYGHERSQTNYYNHDGYK